MSKSYEKYLSDRYTAEYFSVSRWAEDHCLTEVEAVRILTENGIEL